MLERGDAVPHFTVTDVAGKTIAYASIWQRHVLALIALSSDDATASSYAASVGTALSGLEDTAAVITRGRIPDLTPPAIVIADRWGEIVHAVRAERACDLPSAEDLLGWIEHVRQRCPECEGESR